MAKAGESPSAPAASSPKKTSMPASPGGAGYAGRGPGDLLCFHELANAINRRFVEDPALSPSRKAANLRHGGERDCGQRYYNIAITIAVCLPRSLSGFLDDAIGFSYA